MHFGEPVDEERLVRAAAARRRDRHRDHRRRLRRGRGRPAARPGARRRRPRLVLARRRRRPRLRRRRARRAARLSRGSPTRACAAPAITPPTCARRPRRASSGSGSRRFDLLLLHNPDRTGFTSEAVWDGMAALRDAGLTDAIGVAPGPANGFTLDLHRLLRALRRPDRLGDGDPQPARAVARRALPRRGRRARRAGDHPGRRLRRPVLGRRPARPRVRASTTTGASAPTAGSRRARERLERMRPIAERRRAHADAARLPVEPRPRPRSPARPRP